MDEHEHHEELIKNIAEEYASILKNSPQGIYIYFDDNHKICNSKFAEMLGYTIEDWSKQAPFVETFVTPESGETLVSAYQDAMEKSVAAEIDVTWKKKDGSSLATEVILVPVSFQGHHFALHFVYPDK